MHLGGQGFLLSAIAGLPFSRAIASAGPWRSLFNGRNLNGWTFFQDGVGAIDAHNVASVQDGALALFGKKYNGGSTPGSGHIAAIGEFSNFHLRLQQKWGARRFEPASLRKRNGGLVIFMAPDLDKPWPDGVELNIQEGDMGDMVGTNTRALQGLTHSGAFVWPPSRQAGEADYAPTTTIGGIARQRLVKDGNFENLNHWNTIEVIAAEDTAAFIVNGRIVNVIYGIQRLTDAASGTYTMLKGGRIGLQIQSCEASYRSIEIRNLG